MHDELYAAIPDNVYTALDACAHLSPAQRSKLQEACKKSSSGALFDAATGAPFGHQLQLNAHPRRSRPAWEPAAAEGRSPPPSPEVPPPLDGLHRRHAAGRRQSRRSLRAALGGAFLLVNPAEKTSESF
jgi:hypothetical protein